MVPNKNCILDILRSVADSNASSHALCFPLNADDWKTLKYLGKYSREEISANVSYCKNYGLVDGIRAYSNYVAIIMKITKIG